ncbi:MAG: diversity-generating retroelement protein Avd [candidate division KSB1 bacterium]|nr:diversity-generating retroelement protein Avd [candidate division KSB1 bacterium]MDZ7272560.1 diversity-generating retroelement protein Avd [candidate division KSB1 bacterium]MDZ7284417.1 diversity-generating retroelement protein Avd [candidate division KSB1 bacterium]MDZ7297187.1 diversity-generating retroelement protein Avd [candidate division KSB1 bacterium]MDZ7308623.1 diversity-generating retroelement protein Avd [candidate division KSB1 bacterium]
MAEELKLVQKSYDLCQWLFNHTEKFPKSRRFSMAVRIENQFLDFLELVSLASYRKQKLPLLQKADEHLFFLRLLVRLSHSMKLITTGSYEFAAQGLDEIGRMLGGLMKKFVVAPSGAGRPEE